MDNQHRKIKVCNKLSQSEIDMMNLIRARGVELSDLVEELGEKDIDQRWVSIGATHLQTGLMALTRAVAQPDFF